MDAIAPSTTSSPALPVRPPAVREPDPATATRTPAPPPTPVPSFEAPALPLSVQREHLRPPPTPLMSGEQMSALLQALVHGGPRTVGSG